MYVILGHTCGLFIGCMRTHALGRQVTTPDALAVVRPTGVYLLDFFCSVFSFIYCSLLIFALSPFLYVDLYFLGDDALISKGSFMQTKHLCVLIHI